MSLSAAVAKMPCPLQANPYFFISPFKTHRYPAGVVTKICSHVEMELDPQGDLNFHKDQADKKYERPEGGSGAAQDGRARCGPWEDEGVNLLVTYFWGQQGDLSSGGVSVDLPGTSHA